MLAPMLLTWMCDRTLTVTLTTVLEFSKGHPCCGLKAVSHGARPTCLGTTFPMRGGSLFWTCAANEGRQRKRENAPRGPVKLSRVCSFVHTLASDKSRGRVGEC